MQTIRYGESVDQEADLYHPGTQNPPVVCLLHGGFWKMPHGKDQMEAMARDLASHGFAVWNIEYRRLGAEHAGWPATFLDVASAIQHMDALVASGSDLDLDRVAIAGHSAGGHLALWAGRAAAGKSRIRIAVAVGLAPIADLARALEMKVGGDVVAELMGGRPGKNADRYREASPSEMLPLGVRQLLIHGADDQAVPIELSRDYTDKATRAGDTVELIELQGMGHMEFLDTSSAAYSVFRGRIEAILK